MTDNTANTPAPGSETPASTEPLKPAMGTGTGETPATTTETFTQAEAARQIEELKAALKKVNGESASHRMKAKELDELKAKAEADKLSETEKLQKKLTELQSQHDTATRQYQERLIGAEVRAQAAQLGIINPALAAKALDMSQIEFDEAGAPKNIGDLLKELLKTDPYLAAKPVASTPTAGGATSPARSQSSASQALSWEVIGKLKAEEYAARAPEIQAWIAANPYRFGQRR